MFFIHGRWHIEQVRYRRVGGGKVVTVNRQRACQPVRFCAEVRGRRQRHVAFVTTVDGLIRIIEACDAVTRDTAQQVRVVMILAPQPAVVVKFFR